MKFIRRKDAAKLVGFTPTHIMRLAKAGDFPTPIQIGENSVAFLEIEVIQWMEERLAERDALVA